MTRDPIRWGVISTANIGRWAVNPAIQAADGNELLAVASRNPDRASAFAAEGGIPRHYGRYADLLADGDVDAVYIPLPNSLHREWTIRAAEAGKHILCEKPLALTEAECREMSAAAEASGVILMEAFMYRFHPRTERILTMIREGTIGEVKMIHSAFTFRLKSPDNIRLRPELGGGSLMDVGCYCVNISRTVAGREPVEVQAVMSEADSGVDAMMVGTMRFADELLATFECGLNTRRREMVEISGTDGYLALERAFLPGTGDVTIEEFGEKEDPVIHAIHGVDEYRCMVEHFSECVRSGQRPRYPADEAALNMRVIEALYRSARSGGMSVTVGS